MLFCFFSLGFAEPSDDLSPLEQTRMLGVQLLQEGGLEEELNKSAIRGMLEYIDTKIGFGHSQLITAEEKDQILEYKKGMREGYGLRVQLLERKGFVIEHVFQDGSAHKSGLRKGDLIISVGKKSLMGKRSKEMVEILNQPPQSQVRFEVLRDGHLVSFLVSRGHYFLHPVSVYGNVVQVHYFGQDVAKKLKSIVKERASSPLILDLRNNEGGSIEEVQRAVGLFIPNTLMGYRHFVEGKQEEIRSIGSDDFRFEQPIYILTNKQTEHASELFVAALQFHKRAVIVGERTAGVASENHFYPINLDLFLYVADVQFWLPSKQSWEGIGLEPSIVVRSSQSIAGGKSIDVQLETVLRLLKSP